MYIIAIFVYIDSYFHTELITLYSFFFVLLGNSAIFHIRIKQ